MKWNEFSHPSLVEHGSNYIWTCDQFNFSLYIFLAVVTPPLYSPPSLALLLCHTYILSLSLSLCLSLLQLFGVGYGHTNAIQSVFVADQFVEEKVL